MATDVIGGTFSDTIGAPICCTRPMSRLRIMPDTITPAHADPDYPIPKSDDYLRATSRDYWPLRSNTLKKDHARATTPVPPTLHGAEYNWKFVRLADPTRIGRDAWDRYNHPMRKPEAQLHRVINCVPCKEMTNKWESRITKDQLASLHQKNFPGQDLDFMCRESSIEARVWCRAPSERGRRSSREMHFSFPHRIPYHINTQTRYHCTLARDKVATGAVPDIMRDDVTYHVAPNFQYKDEYFNRREMQDVLRPDEILYRKKPRHQLITNNETLTQMRKSLCLGRPHFRSFDLTPS